MNKPKVIDTLGTIPIENNNFYKIDRRRINKDNPLYVNEYFYSKNNIKKFENNNKLKIKEIKETEKEKEIEKLENFYLNNKKYDDNYIEKMSYLMYNSKDKNYSIKRKNLDHTIFSYDDKNNLYLTLDEYFKEQNKDKIYIDKNNNKNINLNNNNNNNNNDNKENKKNIFLDLEDKEQEKLYEILKTKENFSQFNTSVNFIPMNQKYFSTQTSQSDINPFLNNNLTEYNNTSNSQTNLNTKYENLNKIKNYPLKTFNNLETYVFNPKKLTVNQRKQMTYLGELTVFKGIRKIREKNKILNHVHNREKKEILPLIDVFHYDKKRWEKRGIEVDINKYNEIQDEKNFQKRKEYISNMNNDSNVTKNLFKELKKLERTKKNKYKTKLLRDSKAFELDEVRLTKKRKSHNLKEKIKI